MSQYKQEQERIKRLGEQDFWLACDASWEEWQAQRPVRKPKPQPQTTQPSTKE